MSFIRSCTGAANIGKSLNDYHHLYSVSRWGERKTLHCQASRHIEG